MKGSSNIFSMSLSYYSPVQSGATARYSRDISSWAWTQYGQPAKAYAFTYDGAHRLTAGQYYNNGTSTNALSEKSISYDKAGNITALSRYNNSGAATSLAYSYTGNRRNNYSYDVNGNVTSDATNSLQSSYNLINLPAQIKSGSTVKANYTHLSDGTKAKALNASSAGYDYAGSFTYSHASNGTKTLESVAFGGGRIRKSGSTYAVDYHITDHLGSVRAIVNASGSIVEQNDYYPFGTRHPNGLTQLSANRWRFSGKEEQDGFGIAYSDFGARLYDRSASWTAIDPMAEKYYAASPYAYCHNNPLLYVDPDGKDGYEGSHGEYRWFSKMESPSFCDTDGVEWTWITSSKEDWKEAMLIREANIEALVSLSFDRNIVSKDVRLYAGDSPLFTKESYLQNANSYINGWRAAFNSETGEMDSFVSGEIEHSGLQLKYYPQKGGVKQASSLGLVRTAPINHFWEGALERIERLLYLEKADTDPLYDMHVLNANRLLEWKEHDK